jgi:hypothetical protein
MLVVKIRVVKLQVGFVVVVVGEGGVGILAVASVWG